MTVRHIPGRITALVSRLRRDREANVAVMFAIAAIPVLGMVGAATDYSLATRMKAKLRLRRSLSFQPAGRRPCR
jgi:Flp pilus assembly protein TadG